MSRKTTGDDKAVRELRAEVQALWQRVRSLERDVRSMTSRMMDDERPRRRRYADDEEEGDL